MMHKAVSTLCFQWSQPTKGRGDWEDRISQGNVRLKRVMSKQPNVKGKDSHQESKLPLYPSRSELSHEEIRAPFMVTVTSHPTTTPALCLQAHGPRGIRRWAEEGD